MKKNNSPSCVHVLHKTLPIWSFHDVVLPRTAKKCTKIKNAFAERFFIRYFLVKSIVWRRCFCRRRGRRFACLFVCFFKVPPRTRTIPLTTQANNQVAISKERFTRYDFVACDKLTTGLRHKLLRVNQTYNSLTTHLYVKKKKCRRILKQS